MTDGPTDGPTDGSTDGSTDAGWVVRDERELPQSVIDGAAAAQATLAAKLAELRAGREPFPGGIDPAAADRWITDGGATARRGGGSDDPTAR
jgi:hypothetical protein